MTTFRTILAANRGEIACRVMRTARDMGYRTAAVYSEADADALHVRCADVAACIGPAEARASYLNIAAIIAAAKQMGADAVHPGYGFLSENADFARACAEAGLTFIGPPPAAIAAMGNKAAAKRRMLEAGVPCVPGYQGADQSEAMLTHEAERIGFPVMVKAAAGGGGRGMRLVPAKKDLAAALAGARAEAENAFGSGELILEKAVVDGRHVEIQVLADTHGNVIHLGERDCSVQRRHQKVLEEAPSPAVGPELRARMGAAAVAAAKAIGYTNAGTVEFLLGADGAFYFLEMNTRLQVEHPVTEMVTGLDLVAAADPHRRRRATADQSGRPVAWLDMPSRRGCTPRRRTRASCRSRASSPCGVRPAAVDCASITASTRARPSAPTTIRCSPRSSPWAHRARRRGRRLMQALEQTVALGTGTNRAFLHRCPEPSRVRRRQATTQFVPKHFAKVPAPIRRCCRARRCRRAVVRGKRAAPWPRSRVRMVLQRRARLAAQAAGRW